MTERSNLRVLTWHIHGSYLYYLTQTPCTFYLPHKNSKEEGYGARTPSFPWGDNVISVPAEEVKNLEFDVILFQSKKNYTHDQYEILSDKQRALPKIYLEHDPPREVPTDTKHVVDDPNTLLAHVTHFNRLMWDNNSSPTTVIEHGVVDPGYLYKGTLDKGIVVINGIVKRGRRLGLDVFKKVREEIPLDIVGMGSEEVGGLGDINNRKLPELISQYRFFFNPIRYTSLGLSVCEAMMAGLPIVGLATTEMSITVTNGQSGYISTDVDFLIEKMKMLLNNPDKAQTLSQGARETALQKFNMKRFTNDWLKIFHQVVNKTYVNNNITESIYSESEP
ncbi:glycosyltransferase family 4 protein [Chryseosolibacter indicus]|uniref:Glycosyltransferase n=1 Tax=Chryseosolibacter indicus TaxID=2782351 RepID=A0ABS5VNC0_9BACT|nr:glycosyltransferase [Chryseosolibacter indicus]MBT1702861.1 glycosyltransferase [Chryseosolibacter indicus]